MIRWLPFETDPYPYSDGMPSHLPADDFCGLNELKSVTNEPLGLDRYPTAPSSTGDGSHNGSLTICTRE